ncbi:hypothetical protein HPB51_004752 [Rhipicephalus microplus]|uniref:THAP-type domain-containing protein n=1 Tax=Rhipicephalus microplus TaxID=6941 RepID=A0A9J6DST8_RHIMP|nr:hypothetical protein HPB51_004752 [Rhipicephalus microplus]
MSSNVFKLFKNLGKRHKACFTSSWCDNSGRNSSVKFLRFLVDEKGDVWRNNAKRPDLEELTRVQLYGGYRLCSDHFTDSAYANPAKTWLFLAAALTTAGEVG